MALLICREDQQGYSAKFGSGRYSITQAEGRLGLYVAHWHDSPLPEAIGVVIARALTSFAKPISSRATTKKSAPCRAGR